ncbi:glycoside hydrolase family 13 protein [Fibrivirga algicola]|uniref:Glycoside hydrolase family 13 protein n=1 Tax=Fibrivirga algicola TaxID=2950420 RepID=A0ABX0QG50_9BACT|nr:glycoside hydrolase family 13 protein [Fibrivirga algicola]NID10170.1 glycoside hydrolase family 13 protein [Fibrivirga algicola]
MTIYRLLLVSSLVLITRFALVAQRVEPAFWWVGMKDTRLQLLIHAPAIAETQPKLAFTGVKLMKVTKVKSPNYLFIDLVVSPTAKPGTFPIQFLKNGQAVFTYQYELKARSTGSAQRQGYTPADVMYLITPDRFANGDPANDNVPGMPDPASRTGRDTRHGGDIQGIIDNLDYINDMGFTALWINPLIENKMPQASYHGYASTDFYKVDPRFGTNEDYRTLSKAAQKKGIKLVIDMIMNHCGSGHWWMADLPTDDWLNYQDKPQITNHSRETNQDPHASEYDKKLFADGWFVPSMPDMNQRNPLLAQYLIQNTIWWIEYADLHGIRMDTYPYPDKAFMAEWSRRVMQEYPNFSMVGEEWSMNPAIIAFWQKGKQNRNGYVSYMPNMFDFPQQNALVSALNEDDKVYNQGLMKLYQTLALDFLYENPTNLVVFPDNHDMSRFYTQINEKFDRWKMGMIQLLTTRGIPQFFYGTEILMTNPKSDRHDEIRGEMPGGWPDHTASAFTGKGLTDRQLEAQQFLKQLLQWRRRTPVLHTGKLTHFAASNGVYVYFRHNALQKIMVVMNKNSESKTLNTAHYAELLSGHKTARNIQTDQTQPLTQPLVIPAMSAVILDVK